MIYPPLDLAWTEAAVGLLLLALGGLGLATGDRARTLLRSFPRSGRAGFTLLTAVACWAFALLATMDLGEFSPLRTALLLLVVAAYFLTLKFADEFLAVRALGMCALLLAEPLLEAAFLQPPTSRLVLVVFAYGLVVAGMFWVGMPYLLRDHIAWATKTGPRWRLTCGAGAGYGLALVAVGLATLFGRGHP